MSLPSLHKTKAFQESEATEPTEGETMSQELVTTRMDRVVRKRHKARAQPGWEEKFLESFRKCGCLQYAAEDADVHPRWVRQKKVSNEDFAVAFAEAKDYYLDSLEHEIDRRARHRYNQKGHLVEKGSDLLLIFKAKAEMPWKYRDNWNPSNELDESQIQAIVDALNATAFDLEWSEPEKRRMVMTFAKHLRKREDKVVPA
jgi:hypothetical protein